MIEHPNNKNRPENDSDKFIKDFIHTDTFIKLLGRALVDDSLAQIFENKTSEMPTFVSKVHEIYDITMLHYDGNFDIMAVNEGYDVNDPTHIMLIKSAEKLRNMFNGVDF